MRILWVASRLEWQGGIGRVLWGATRALRAQGHAVHVVGGMEGPPAAVAASAPEGVEVHPWPRSRWKLRGLPALVSLVRALRPEIVHFHSTLPHGELVVGLRLIRGRGRLPLLFVTPHTSNRTHYPKRRARWGLRAADGVIVPSQWSAERAIEAGASREHTCVVHAGIDLPESRSAVREPVVLFVGRLKPVKGVDVLIDAFSTAAATRPEWRLEIAGKGSGEGELRARAARSPCADRMVFLGHLRGAGKERALERTSLAVVPSHRESYGGVLLEFQAHGIPCIASATGGLTELAHGGRAARLVPPGDSTALAAALAELMDDASRRDTLAAAGQRAAAERSWSATARDYERVYSAALARVGSPVNG